MSALLDSLAGQERRASCAMHHRHVVATIAARIACIPCQVAVTHYLRVKPFAGSRFHCDSPEDYFGFTEIEFDVLDSRGRPAPWLEKKLTASDRERVEALIVQHMESPE